MGPFDHICELLNVLTEQKTDGERKKYYKIQYLNRIWMSHFISTICKTGNKYTSGKDGKCSVRLENHEKQARGFLTKFSG